MSDNGDDDPVTATDDGGETYEWSALYDDEGRTYYYNNTTGESSWDEPENYNPPPPPDEEEQQIQQQGQEEGVEGDNAAADDTAAADDSNNDKDDGDGDDGAKMNTGGTSSAWVAYQDDEGREYYVNTETNETTWDRPDDLVAAEPAEEPAPPNETPPNENTSGSSAWVAYQDDEGREYFVNTETNDTTWERPDDFVAAEEQPPPKEGTGGGSSSAWVAYQDDEGRGYYVNTETNETTWDRPDDFVVAEPPQTEEEAAAGEQEGPSSPTRLPSPTSAGYEDGDDDQELQPGTPEVPKSPISEVEATKQEEEEAPEEMEVEEEIDPAVKRLQDAENALNQTDAILEPDVMTHVTEVVANEQGKAQKAIQSLSDSAFGQTAVCGLLARWLADLKAQSSTSDVKEQPKKFEKAANEIRNMTQDVINRISKEKFTREGGDSILHLGRSERAFLGDMMDSDRWRKLLIDLSSSNKDNALLNFCLRAISNRGHHREIARRINQSDHFAVFNAMITSELAVLGKIAVSDCHDKDLSITVADLVGDLRRTCTSTAYTYLHAIEVLRHLVTTARIRPDWQTPENFKLYSRAIRKWERLNEDFQTNLMDPSSAGGGTPLFRKRRFDVAATISELHQRQRRRLLPSSDSTDTSPISNDDDNNSKIRDDRRVKVETAVLNFMRRYSLGTRVDDRILDSMLPDGVAGDPTNAIGSLLIQYPLTVKALLGYLYKPGSSRVGSPVTRNKCARLASLAVLAAEKETIAEAREAGTQVTSESDEVTLSRWILEGCQLCERLEQVVSFLVRVDSDTSSGGPLSTGEKLCALAVKCPSVALGVAIWARDYTLTPDFAASASYASLAPCVMSLLRVLFIHHTFIRDDVLEVSLCFLNNNAEEVSYQRARQIKEQSIRLLLFLAARGEAPTVLGRFTELVKQTGSSSLDSSFIRYFVAGLLEIAEAPFSIVFTRCFITLLKCPGCVEAVRTSYFSGESKSRLNAIMKYFKDMIAKKSEHRLASGDVSMIQSVVSIYAAQ